MMSKKKKKKSFAVHPTKQTNLRKKIAATQGSGQYKKENKYTLSSQ
jgi:hypothetical protein